MEQPVDRDGGNEDVLSLGQGGSEGDGRNPRWARLGTVLLVLLLGLGVYRLVTTPETPAASQAAAADEQPQPDFDDDPPPWVRDERGSYRDGAHGTTLRLGGELVTLRGPGTQVPERELAATALGRIPNGWLVRMTSTACEDATDVRTSYGAARASGRYTPWESSRSGRAWRSPDGRLALVADGKRLELRRTATGRVLTTVPRATT